MFLKKSMIVDLALNHDNIHELLQNKQKYYIPKLNNSEEKN